MKYLLLLGLILSISGCSDAKATEGSKFTNTIGMSFINISAGEYYMGACRAKNLSDEQRKAISQARFLGKPRPEGTLTKCPSGGNPNAYTTDESPEHKVRITKDFQIGIHEVTLGQFKKFIEEGNRQDLITKRFRYGNTSGDNVAVTRVSWNDTQDFIKWLNAKEGGEHYRLPTEAEWEYAARAGTNTRFFWGADAESATNYAWYSKNTGSSSHALEVGQKSPNPWGLYDIIGNVREWVQDWYDENYYAESPVDDPQGPSSGVAKRTRGGCIQNPIGSLASRSRGNVSSYGYNGAIYKPSDSKDFLGFRLVRQVLRK